ncbi:MAG TPA: protein kinase [Solirubrobacteraceae bacterium]|nr:protein kinase [Solirubrobacteraceae bacterium]
MSETDNVIAGRYRLEGRLGFGGMSTVHLAFDMRLERRVAVKLLAEHLADDPTFVSRFQREAQAAARLVHPNIVQIFDSGLDERSGRHFIVMEYIEGQSCAEILRDDGWVQVEEAVAIIEQACEGLHYAHRHGVVHRDVKPGNLLRAREGEVKLADFGIAKATEQSSITQVGSVLGTAAYLAPEQARGEEAGPRADLYALGVVAYQLISGRLPYEATSLTELALKQQREEPSMLDTLVAAVGPELAEAIALALALDPRERYQTAREMGRAISDGADGISPLESPAPSHSAGRGAAGQAGRSPIGQATSVLSGGARGSSAAGAKPAVVPRRPRQGPARSGAAAAASARPTAVPVSGARSRGPRRLALSLLGLLALGGVIAAIVAITAPAPTKVMLRNVVYNDVERASVALKQLVSENTK